MSTTTHVVYARASSDPRDTYSSVTVQTKRGIEVGNLNGWRALPPIVDNDKSAAQGSKKRPGFEQLKDLVAAKRVDYITVFSSSRLTRDSFEFNDVLRLLQGSSTKLCINGGVLDPNNPEHVLQGRITNAFDSYLIEQIRKNTTATLDENAKAGKPHGPIPFGYVRVYDEHTRRVVTQVEHPTQADDFRRYVSDLLAGRITVGKIAREIGYSTYAVTRMLQNPTYIGVRMHKGTEYPAVWDGLIGEDEFRALGRLIEGAKRGPLSSPMRKHPYTGLLYCAVCGGRLTSRNPSTRVSFRRYLCRTRGCVTPRADVLDAYIEERLQVAIKKLSTGSTEEEDDTELVALRRRLDTLKEKAQEIRDDYKAEVTSRDEYVEFRDDNAEKIAEVQSDIDEASPTLELDGLIGQEVAEMTDDEKHVAAVRLIERITVKPSGRCKGVPMRDLVRIEWLSTASAP